MSVIKIEVDGKPKQAVIYDNVKKTIIFYLVISFLILAGMYFSRYCNEPYKYLLISPSFYNNSYLNWITGVWGSFLGIHGTIAALSITFMGMFVDQVSKTSEHGFESLSKVLLLREYNFLGFSVQSVCSLLCGVFLLLIGSGLIGYFISSFFSLFFIFKYGIMYYRLYNITEESGVINGILLDSIRSTGKKYNEVNNQRQEITNEFSKVISSCNYYSNDQSTFYWSDDAITLNIFPEGNDIAISGYKPKVFSELSNKLMEFNLKHAPTIFISLSFLSPISTSSIKIITTVDSDLTEAHISEIESILKKGISYSIIPYVYSDFKKIEEALVENIRNCLLNGDEWSLDFGVRIFNELTSNENYINTLRNIDLSITSSNTKDLVKTSMLAKFFEKMIYEAFNQNDLEKAANIMRSLIGLARYIYSKSNFSDFYKRIFRLFEHRVRYRSEESNYVFLDLYISIVLRNLVYNNYAAFKVDTDFVTNRLQYLDLSNKAEHDSLNEMQRKMLRCLFEVITLLIMRIEHVEKKEGEYKEELNDLISLLKSWVNAKFLQELYYKKELYDVLFSIPQEFSVFDAETKIREIPDGEATWRSVSNDTYKMIAFILTQSSFNNNQLNLLFVRDVNEFKDATSILTHELNSIVKYMNGESFSKLFTLITNTDVTDNKNKQQVVSKLESIISALNSLVLRNIIESELEPSLVDKYKNEITLSVEKLFELIMPLDNIALGIEINGIDTYLLINKREVLPATDGVSYEMNIHNHSQWLVYEWIRSVLNSINANVVNIININDPEDLLVDKLITIEYMVEDRSNTFRYSRGLKITDKEGHLKLNGSGLYYLDLLSNFELEKSNELLSVNIEKVTDGNIEVIKDRYNFENDNPYLYSILYATFNIVAVPNNVCNLYFLSEEACQIINERQEREMEQLIIGNRTENPDNSNVA
ncbi:hypothetical protein [Enterobacter sp. ENT02]|uniref:hypothetical protein n=1 Tax=Enterobacter sp. ENT02 TaxID=2854767 RepID=UPI001C45D3D3|nr:hypothetical protein [Enterobacter sp. ENT02]MBV7557107.1 hypothetical protein [Enterobacter sp. ENT02]